MKTLEKVLYVDDDEDVRTVVRIVLEQVGGFEVRTCDSGAAALVVAVDFLPDLIILDVMMPGLDGPSTLKALRATPLIGSPPIVFMTAKTMQSEIEAYQDLGVTSVISKPFDPMTLPDRLREIWTCVNA